MFSSVSSSHEYLLVVSYIHPVQRLFFSPLSLGRCTTTKLKRLHFNTLGLTLASADKLETQDKTRLSSLQSAISWSRQVDYQSSVRASPGPGRLIPSILDTLLVCLIFTGSGTLANEFSGPFFSPHLSSASRYPECGALSGQLNLPCVETFLVL